MTEQPSIEDLRKRGLEQVISSLNLKPEDLEMIGRIVKLKDDPRVNNVEPAYPHSYSIFKIHLKDSIDAKSESRKILNDGGFPESRTALPGNGDYQCTIFMSHPRTYELIFSNNKKE